MHSADPLDQIQNAFHNNNAPLLRDLLIAHPALKAQINQPLFPFDSPALIHARSKEIL